MMKNQHNASETPVLHGARESRYSEELDFDFLTKSINSMAKTNESMNFQKKFNAYFQEDHQKETNLQREYDRNILVNFNRQLQGADEVAVNLSSRLVPNFKTPNIFSYFFSDLS